MKPHSMLHGHCHCRAVRFQMPAEVTFSTICNCSDRRGQSGAPVVAWAMVPADQVVVEGCVEVYKSSETGRRSLCPRCGTGFFFSNGALDAMRMLQVRVAALEDPDAVRPNVQVQTAEQIGWMRTAHELPKFDRFPG